MISPCIEPGCSKLCMGLFCIDHDSGPRADLPRGRPWPPARRGQAVTLPLVASGVRTQPATAERAPVTPAA
jgi:hypothetical protein